MKTKFYQDKWFWLSIIAFLTIGLLSGIFAVNAQGYYKELILPNFAPPGFLFGPVWFILYILIGISHYFLWKWENRKIRNWLIGGFYLQFGLNFIWSFFFFTMKNTGLALFDIAILFVILFMMQAIFFREDKKIMWLMGPYFLWVTFASVLNIAIYMLN